MPRDPRYWEQVVLSENNTWFWSPALVSGINDNITETKSPSTPFAYRIEDTRGESIILRATVTVRNESDGRPLMRPYSSAIVPVCSFVHASTLPKLHSLPEMRRLVLEPPAPTDWALYNRHKIRILDNIRHFLGFFGQLTDEQTYYNDSAFLAEMYSETLPVLVGHTLPSIVLPLDLRDGLDSVLQSLSQHGGLFDIKFTHPTSFNASVVHPSQLASFFCPSLQLLRSLRNITIPDESACIELLYVLSTFPNLAKITVTPSSGYEGSRFVELVLNYGYTAQHFPSLRHIDIGAQHIRSSSLAHILVRFPGVRMS